MKKTKVSDLGYRTPIGSPSGGRSFKFKPWRAKDERKIGEMRSRAGQGRSVGAFTSEVLAHFLTEWQGEDFAEKKLGEKKLALNQAHAADIYHAWIMLRREALGDELPMDICCHVCSHKFAFKADLSSLDVIVADDDEILDRPVRLRDGVEFRGELRNIATLSPLRWEMFEKLKANPGQNLGTVKLAVIASSLSGFNGCEGVKVHGSVLDELTKYDLEVLSSEVDKAQPGPDFRVDIECPECMSQITDSVSWVYDSFFSVRGSSLSEPPSNSSPNSITSSMPAKEDSPSTPGSSPPASGSSSLTS